MTPLNLHSRKTWNSIFIHLAVWCILFILPLIFFDRVNEMNNTERFKLLRICMQPICIAFVFYINYFFLIDKTLFRQKISRYIFCNLFWVVLCCFIIYIVNYFIGDPPPGPFHEHIGPRSLIPILWQDAIMLTLVVGLSVAIKITKKWVSIEKKRQQLEQERIESELKNLKNQLNPHFLFNTLNNIYSLIAISPEQAQNSVLELSKLLRYMLYENTQSHVPIEKELDFNHNYIELMRLRLARHVQVEVNIPDQVCHGRKIAPFLFISLIENAFKHGTSATENSFVKINIKEPESGIVACYIENSYFPKTESDKSGSGIGLKNLTRQLDLLYPEKYSLKSEYDSKSYRTHLVIDLK